MVKKTDFNTKVTEIEGKIPDVSSLVKKIDYATEIANIKNYYITNAASNARYKDLIQKTKFDTEVKKINDNIVLTCNNRLNQSKDAIDDLERYASYFRGKNYFDGNDRAQNTLVFQTMQKHCNLVNEYQIDEWKSKGLFNQYLDLIGTGGDIVLSKPIKPMHVIFKRKGTLAHRDNDIITGGPIINIYIVYNTSPKTINLNFVLKNCLFGAIKITNTTNSDTDKWQYSGYGAGFDSAGSFTNADGGNGKIVIIFGVDLGNFRHENNKTQSVLVLGHGLIQKINDTTTCAEKMYSRNFTVDNETFCLSLHYNGDNSYLFVNGKEITKFKAKNSELIKYPMCLGNLSKDYRTDSRKSTGLYGNVYDFSVDYTAISNDKIHDIHAFLMRKNYII